METLPQTEGTFPGVSFGDGLTPHPGILGNALNTTTRGSYLNYGEIPNTCFREPNLCAEGYTVSLWLRRYTVVEGTEFYISNGGQYPGMTGFAVSGARISGIGNFLSFLFRTNTTAEFVLMENAPDDRWIHVTMTWHETSGLDVYVDGDLLNVNKTAPTANHKWSEETYSDLMIGRSNDFNTFYAVVSIDEFVFWDSFKSAEFVREFYESYSTMHLMSFRENSVFRLEGNVAVVGVSPISACAVRASEDGPHPCRLDCMWLPWCGAVEVEGHRCRFFNIVSLTNLTVSRGTSDVFVKV
jgi:hypothetical protein